MSEVSKQSKPQVQGTASFSKFMNVLQAIADSPNIDITGLMNVVPYPRPTLYRLLSALINEELVMENGDRGTFKLGTRLISLAARARDEHDLRSIAHRHVAALRDTTGETVHLAVPSGLEMVYVDKLESPQNVRMISRIGTRVNLHSTSVGKAYLAALDSAVRENILAQLQLTRRTEHTITNLDQLRDELAQTQQRGFSLDWEENELDIRCFGAAILDCGGQPIGCVSVSVPKYRYDSIDTKLFQTAIRATVDTISKSL
ncbi:transcriptional regulator, IclR family [Marinobacter salarius]|uniref:HTH-type transcriptional repressor AllR n=1 Tax=Marinobacter salarius TaxID=1420917 RepID=W5YNZ8_9GAMM|nr:MULTISPECIES: IclR family transcriptional regulator [Marinobacter]AHI30836.1 IclR family transcriptional regulator [Marinobacter salarius]KXJ46869.1 MAG: IclR family transcriptional regulator [Marinobacter sp. Hex_13]SFL86661.1 transcriptional regulator, IclR family [Marinobacter salarius]